jgi:calcium/calmodulin-dependent protein kinase I
LKPENLLYVTTEPNSDLVLADFGIAKTLDSKEDSLQTMAGSFGYAAPEVMDRQGHGKPVDMWSLGVITYTLLCGYSPFRSENLKDLLMECTQNTVVFHERYWRDVSDDAKDFILRLIVPDQNKRWTSEQAMKHSWLSGETATDHDLLPDLRSYRSRMRLKRAIEVVKLRNRIKALKDKDEDPENSDMADLEDDDKAGDGARLQALGLFALKEAKAKQESLQVEETIAKEAKRRSGQFSG